MTTIPVPNSRIPVHLYVRLYVHAKLKRLMGVRLSGEHKGDPWGAWSSPEWHIVHSGSMEYPLAPP